MGKGPGQLVGRESDKEALAARLLDEPPLLLTIVGPPGTGKTALALLVADEVACSVATSSGSTTSGSTSSTTTFARVATVRLAAVNDVAGLARMVAEGLFGATDSSGGSSDVDVIGRALDLQGRILLVLDNLEQIEGAGDVIGRWFEQAPALSVLATSRHVLGAPKEHIYPLGPLPYELDAGNEARAEQTLPPAGILFERRAQEHRHGFRLAAEDPAVVARVLRKLEGNPLAIELAAARLEIMGLAALHRHLVGEEPSDPREPGLRITPTGALERGLESAIASSFELLTEHERAVLMQAAVFNAGFTVDLAAATMRLSPDAPPLLDLLRNLKSKSLLQTREGPSGEVLLDTFESVRDFCLRRPEGAELRRDVGERAAAHWIDVTLQREPADRPRRAVVVGVDIPRAISILRGGYREGRVGAEQLLSAVVAAGVEAIRAEAHDRTLREMQGALEDVAEEKSLLVPAARVAVGRAELSRHRLDDAIHSFRAALRWPVVDPRTRGQAREGIGSSLFRKFQHDAALAEFERAREAYEEDGDVRNIVYVLCHQGGSAQSMGAVERARVLYEEAVQRSREAGDPRGVGLAFGGLAAVAIEAERYEMAASHLIEGLALTHGRNLQRKEAVMLGYLGLCRFALGRYEEARETLQRAIEQCRALGHVTGFAGFSSILAASLAADDRRGEAERVIAKAYEAAHGDLFLQAFVDLYAAHVELARSREAQRAGDEQLARDRWLAAAERIDAARGETAKRRYLARGGKPLYAISDDVRWAVTLLEKALEGGRHRMTASEGGERPKITIGFGGRWFEIEGRERVDLSRKRVTARLLWVLAERHVEAGDVISPASLIEATWPDENLDAKTGTGRLYVAINQLRQIGLEGLLASKEGGYRLEAAVSVAFDR